MIVMGLIPRLAMTQWLVSLCLSLSVVNSYVMSAVLLWALLSVAPLLRSKFYDIFFVYGLTVKWYQAAIERMPGIAPLSSPATKLARALPFSGCRHWHRHCTCSESRNVGEKVAVSDRCGLR